MAEELISNLGYETPQSDTKCQKLLECILTGYRFGSFLAPLSVGIITSRHYLSECNKNGERTSGTSETGDNKNGGDKKTAE